MVFMSLDKVIQQVQRHAQVLATEWQETQVKVSSHPFPCQGESVSPNLFLSWDQIDHLFFYPVDMVFLSVAYQKIFGRVLDEEGKRFYGEHLAQGMPRVFVILHLLAAQEALTFTGLPRIRFFKPLWLIDKVFNRLNVRLLRRAYWKLIRLWEMQQIKKLSVMSAWYDQVQTMLLKHLDIYLSEQNIALTQQIATSQAMVMGVMNTQHLLHHKLNYHQAIYQQVIDDLAHPKAVSIVQDTAQQHQQDVLDAYYVAFEDANRGTREEVLCKHQPYLSLIDKHRKQFQQLWSLPILDVGCGRGEWLQLLKEHQMEAVGIDMNPVMITTCQQQGLRVHHSDAVTWLKQQQDNSVALITGFHIIEHLPFEVLFNLFAEAYRVLAPSGMIIFETPNPENILVGSHTFYHDFTHRNPITPTAIQFLAQYHNFGDIDILRLHPYPSEAKVAGHDALTERVNGHLTGPQDFAILAVKPNLVTEEGLCES
jgi:O-antigen chain-terminating methyltransferase